MKVTTLAVPDVKLLEPQIFMDARGYFLETYQVGRYAAAGLVEPFVQDNVSHSHYGVLRGLHYQWPGNPQGKLVSVVHGRVWDVAVDVRRGSPTFGTAVGVELDAVSHRQLWIPPGFAHGFVVLSESATFCYKCTAPYSPSDEVSIRWDDKDLQVPWPLRSPIVSERDASAPTLADLPPERVPRFGAPISTSLQR